VGVMGWWWLKGAWGGGGAPNHTCLPPSKWAALGLSRGLRTLVPGMQSSLSVSEACLRLDSGVPAPALDLHHHLVICTIARGYGKLHLHSVHSLHKLVQLRRSLERSPEARGRWSDKCCDLPIGPGR